jgi:hypothetical protein
VVRQVAIRTALDRVGFVDMSGVDPSLRAQIRAQVLAIDPDENGCRVWPETFAGGYAYMRASGKPAYAHKIAYGVEGMAIARTCGNKACLEPTHIEIVPPLTWVVPRLEAKTDFDGPVPWHTPELGNCWEWTGRKIWGGYGLIYWHSDQWLVHRVAYTVFVGDIPDKLQIDHLCRNRACIRPTHLEPVTHGENVRRGVRFRRTYAGR